MEVVPYEPRWLGALGDLARVHARLAPPGIVLTDDEVARGLEQHAYWPFYSPGLSGGQTLLVAEGDEALGERERPEAAPVREAMR